MLIQEEKVHPSWRKLLTPKFIKEIQKVEESIGKNYFPEEENVMRFLQTDLKNAKCIFIGTEPYTTYYLENTTPHPVATGRSFELGNIDSWTRPYKQAPMRNMLKTIYYYKTGVVKSVQQIRKEIQDKKISIASPPKWFDSLERQGVIFLDATLTVKKGIEDSHTDIWEKAMGMILKYIYKNSNATWIILGDVAQERVIKNLGIKENFILCVHPRNKVFIEENPFSKINGIKWDGLDN